VLLVLRLSLLLAWRLPWPVQLFLLLAWRRLSLLLVLLSWLLPYSSLLNKQMENCAILSHG